MALTKVSGGILDPGINVAGIVTATGFDGPFVGGSNGINAGIITATGFDLNGNGDISGNLVIGGNLTANGDFTTLNTTLREVEILRVDANTTAVAGIITQRGSGDILNLFDNSTEVFTVKDGGNVGINSTAPTVKLDVNGTAKFNDDITLNGANFDITYDRSLNTVNFDQSFLKFGTSGQLVFRSSGSFSTIDSTAGLVMTVSSLEVKQTSGDKMIKTYNNGAVELYHDDIKTAFTGQDQWIVHGRTANSGMVEIASNQGANNNDRFRIHKTSAASRLTIQNYASGSWVENIRITAGGAVELKHSDGTTKFETQSSGAIVLGALRLQGDNTGYITGQAQPLIYRTGSTSGSYPFNNYGHLVIQTRTDSSNRDIIFATGTSSANQIVINSSGDMKFPDGKELQFGGPLDSGDGDLRLYHNATDSYISNGTGHLRIGNTHDNKNIKFFTNGSTRWDIDSDGHFIPDTAGAVNIGSATAEIGNIFLADSKKVFLGSDQDVSIYHDGTHGYLTNTTGNLFVTSSGTNYTYVDSNFFRIRDSSGNHMFDVNSGGAHQGVGLYYSAGSQGAEKLRTSATGITVTGEVAASQDYPQSDPNIDFVFTKVKKLDPRLTYRRSGTASYVDKNGMIKMVGDNVPRFDHDPLTKECKGLLLEPASSNRIHSSTSGIPNVPYAIYGTNSNVNSDKSGTSADTLAPDGSKWTEKVSWKDATFSTNGYYRIGVLNMGTFDAGDYTISTFVKRGIDGNHNLDTLFAGTSALGSSQYHVAIEQYSPSYVAASANWVTTSGVKIQKFQNGWYRISVPLTVSSSFNPLRIAVASHYVLNSSNHETYYKEHDWYYWGMQIEPGDTVTSYMGNYSGDSTNSTGESLRTQRGADCLFMDGQEFKDFYNVAESSIVMQYTLFSGSTYQGQSRAFRMSAESGADTRIDFVNKTNEHPYLAADGSAVIGATGLDAGAVLFQGQTNKIALKVKHQDFATTINGGTVATNTSGSWPPTNRINLLTLGAYDKVGGGGLKGHIQRFTYYPVGLTNNQLITLTS